MSIGGRRRSPKWPTLKDDLERKRLDGETSEPKQEPKTKTASLTQLAADVNAEKTSTLMSSPGTTRAQTIQVLKAKNATLSWDWYSDAQLREMRPFSRQRMLNL